MVTKNIHVRKGIPVRVNSTFLAMSQV